MGLPPSKIKLNLDAYNKEVGPRRRGLRPGSQKIIDERLEKERLAAIRAQNTVDAKIDHQVENQIQDSGMRERHLAAERSAGVRDGQTFVPNLAVTGGPEVPGPAGLATKGFGDAWELAGRTAASNVMSRTKIGPDEFHEETRRQRQLIQEEQDQATNPFEWMIDEVAQFLVPSTVAQKETSGDFPQIGVPLPGGEASGFEPDFHIGTAELATELADVSNFLGPGAISKVATLNKVNKVVKLVEKNGVRGAEIATMTSKDVIKGAKEGVLKWNAQVGAWVDAEKLREFGVSASRPLPDAVPFAERAPRPEPKVFRIEDVFGAGEQFRVGAKNVDRSSARLVDDFGVPLDTVFEVMRPDDIIEFVGPENTFKYVLNRRHEISVNRQLDRGVPSRFATQPARGRESIDNRLRMEESLRGTLGGDDVKLREFVKLLPDEYFDGWNLSFRTSGGPRPDPGEGVTLGLTNYNIKLVEVFSRNVQLSRTPTADTIMHEIGHVLERHLPDDVMLQLNDVYKVQKEAWDKSGFEGLFGTGYLQGGLEPRDYRFKTFSEWFAETMADKGLRDLFPPSTKLIAESLVEKVKLAAVGFIRAIKEKVKPDVVERAYQDLIIGKYKGRRPLNLSRRPISAEVEDELALKVPLPSDLWGKLPSRNHSPKPPKQWVADDMPYSPEQTVQNPFKDEFFAERGIELTDHDKIVYPHEVTMPRKQDGTVDTGAIVNIRKRLDKLDILTVRESLDAVAATIVRQTKTAKGLRQAYNLNRLFAMDEAIARTVDIQFNTAYSKLLQKAAGNDRIGGIVSMIARERFPRVLQEAAQAYDGMISNFNQEISGEFFRLHKKFDQTFRGMSFSITEPMVVVKGEKGVTRPGVVRQAFADIDRFVKDGTYTTKQAHALKLGIQFQNWRTAFDIPRETQRMFKRLENMMEDNLRIEILSGAFRGATDQVATDLEKAYLPQLWNFEGNLLDAQGKLTDTGFQKIFGTKQFFEKSRQFPSIALAVTQMAKTDNPIRLADEIGSPLDLIGARLMAGGRIISDKFLNDEVAAALDLELITSNEGRAFKSILGGGSGEVSTQSEKAISQVVDLTMTGPLRMVRFSMDLGVMGVQALPSINYLAANPLKTIKMGVTAAKYFTRPDAFRQYTAAHPEKWARAQRAGLKVGQEILQKDEGGDWIEQVITMRKRTIRGRTVWVPGKANAWTMPEGVPLVGGKQVYNPIKLMNEAQFSRAMAIIKMEAFEMESDLLWSKSPWNRIQREMFGSKALGVKGVNSRLEADLAAAHAVNERFGGLSNSRALQGKAFRKMLTVPLLTPDFAQATMATALRPIITPTTPEATLARGFWVRNLAVTAMLGTALQTVFGGKEINFTDPTKSDFYVWQRGDDVFNLMGRFGTHAKLIAASVADITNMFQGEVPRNYSDTGPDLSELNTFHRWESFINGRVSSPIELTARLTSQKNYRGEPFWEEDMEPHIGAYAAYIASHGPVPISIVQIREDMANQEFTWARAVYAFIGLSQYPIDHQREQGKASLKYHLAQEIHNATGAGQELADSMANDAVENRKVEFGNRIRPDIVLDPRTGQRLDIDMDKVYAGMATSLGYYMEDRPGQLDLDRARRLGDAGNMTPKERKEHEKYERRRYFDDMEDAAQARLDLGDMIEEEYGPGKEYPTYQSAIRRVGQGMAMLGGETKRKHIQFSDLIEKMKDQRIKPTEQELLFDEVRNALDETVRVDGSVDHWNRLRMMNQLDELEPGLTDKFFEHDENKNEAQIVREWRQMVATASDYYEIPARIFTESEYNTWREWTKFEGNKLEEARYREENGDAATRGAMTLAHEVEIARTKEQRNPDDIEALEVSLWFLDGRQPRHPKTRELLKYHTGKVNPSATEFEQSVDVNTMLEVLSRGEGLTTPQ